MLLGVRGAFLCIDASTRRWEFITSVATSRYSRYSGCMDLTKKHCAPCEDGAEPLGEAESRKYAQEIDAAWQVAERGKKIRREFEFSDFKEAIAFVNRVAEVAEAEGHHPDLMIHYKKVIVELWTHSIGGLSENDFILAAKIDVA